MYFLLFVFLLLSVLAMYQKHIRESSSSDDSKKGMFSSIIFNPPSLLHSFMITLQADSHLSSSGDIGKLMSYFEDVQRHHLHTIHSTGKFIIYWAPGGTGLGNRYRHISSCSTLRALFPPLFHSSLPSNEPL